MTIEELAKKYDEMKDEIISIKIDHAEYRNRMTREIENIRIHLKNVAYLANYQIVELATPEPTTKPKR